MTQRRVIWHPEVVGDYSGPLPDEGYGGVGSVMGVDEDGMEVVGAMPMQLPSMHVLPQVAPQSSLVQVVKPNWRQRQLAPGVIAPDQGLLPLPLTGQTNSGIFTNAIQNITFEGQIQKPFRGERLLVSTDREANGSASGVPQTRILGQLFVGTDLQQLDVPGFDIEQVGQVTGFGVRLTMKPAQPGVFIRLVCALQAALADTQTIGVTITLLGRNIH